MRTVHARDRRQRAEPGSSCAPRWHAVLFALALAALTLAVYAPVRHFDFVELDDPLYVRENAHVAAGLTADGIRWAFTNTPGGFYIPAVWVSYMADVTALGPGPAGHHVVNVLLHLLATLLLFGWLHHATGATVRSWLVAALFAVHPLHVESVAWITERKDVLSAVFWMLGLWIYTAYVRAPSWRLYAALGAVFALGVISKPMIVTFPAILLLVDIWPLGRRVSRRTLWPRIEEKLPLVAIAIAGGLVTLAAHSQQAALSGVASVSVGRRLANALVSYASYVGTTVWPVDLSPFYPLRNWVPPWHTSTAILVLVGLNLVIFRRERRQSPLAVGWLWYLVTLLPVIGFLQAGTQARADRFMYIPAIGLFVAAAWSVPDVVAWRRWRAPVIVPLGVACVAACAVGARAQLWHWQDSARFWTRATVISLGDDEYAAHVRLGTKLREQRRFREATEHFGDAIHIRPTAAQPHVGLALTLAAEGDTSGAIAEFREALERAPDAPAVHSDLGALLVQRGDLAGGIRHLEEAVRLLPDVDLPHLNLALALARTGRPDDAIAQFREVLRINPNHQLARRALNDLTTSTGRR